MHRLKVSLLCLLLLSLSGPAFSQTADSQSTAQQPTGPQPSSAGVASLQSYDAGPGVATLQSYSAGATTAGTYFNARYMSGNGVGYQQGYGQLGGFIPFWVGDEMRGWAMPPRHSAVLEALAAFGIPVCEHRAVARGAEELIAFHAGILAKRDALPFDIDGVVEQWQAGLAECWLRVAALFAVAF